jgi:short-subunit dehydrogenase
MRNPQGVARFKGGWALVTGSARKQGLGYAFCRGLAAQDINIVLADMLADELAARAAELQKDFGVQTRTAACDLGAPPPYTTLDDAVRGIEIDILHCNHMFTPTDTPKILDMPLELHHKVLDVNARAYVTLIHRFGNEMRARGKGAIILTSSGSGLIPTPYTGAYCANKAFQIAFGEALWYELKGTGVDVLVIAAGLMRTSEAVSGYPKWLIADPADVVKEVLPRIGNKHLVIPGPANKFIVWSQTKMQSRRRSIQAMGDFMAKGLGK